jgi:cytochrome b561
MIDKEVIAYFKAAHGFFNLCMLALFCFQGWMGYVIRQARTSGAPIPFDAVRRHRKAGPVFALWGVLGYVTGITVILLDTGRVLEYPLHLFTGSAVIAFIALVYASSRRIAGSEPRSRNIHFILGLCLLALYVVQVLLGLGILL